MLMRYIGGGIGHFKQDIGRTAADTEERASKWTYRRTHDRLLNLSNN